MFRGVVEGFYGKPWSARGRESVVALLSLLESPAYLYAPKSDPYHRLRWREEYPEGTWDELAGLIRTCGGRGVEFLFGISPWAFRDDEAALLRSKAARALDEGAGGIAVLFDDIPDRVDAALARRQIDLAEEALAGLPARIVLCPSAYCIELLESLGGEGYLRAWRERVPGGWLSLWTGDRVVSRELTAASVERAAELLGSVPVLWDNLLADDYALRRIFLAGLEGRTGSGAGYLVNPSEIEPVALHAVLQLLLAEGIRAEWPEALGDREAWDVLRRFHDTPWTDGGAGGLLAELRGALDAGSGEDLAERLEGMEETLTAFVESLPGIEGGFGLMPYALDLRKILYWWRTSLAKGDRAGRIAELRRLAMERLPYEHPLAAGTVETILGEHRGRSMR